MSFNEIFKNPIGFIVLIWISFLTFFSYQFDEKYFFLIPLILMPFYSFQYSFYLPMMRMILIPGPAMFEGVDISCLKNLFKNALSVEFGVTVVLLVSAFLYKSLVPITIIYAFYAILWMFFIALRLKNKFNIEADLQKIEKRFESCRNLFIAVREQVK